MKLVIFGSGRGSNFIAIHKSIMNGQLNATISAIVVNNPRAEMINYALENQIPALVHDHSGLSRDEHETGILESLSMIDYDLVVLAGYMRILSSNFLRKLEKPIVNIHPSLLPSFKGLHAQKQALDYGVKITGCTVHIVSEEVDGGKILGQKCVEVKEGDDVDSLSERILKQEHILYSEVLQSISNGEIRLD